MSLIRKILESFSLIGHNGSINTVRMGHTNQLIVSSSSDQTVKLWMPGHADPVMNIDHYKHNFHADKVTNVNTKVCRQNNFLSVSSV